MTELPCFLSTEHSVFLLGNCGYETTLNPFITLIQLFPIGMIIVLGIGLSYFGVKHLKEKNTQHNSKDEVRK